MVHHWRHSTVFLGVNTPWHRKCLFPQIPSSVPAPTGIKDDLCSTSQFSESSWFGRASAEPELSLIPFQQSAVCPFGIRGLLRLSESLFDMAAFLFVYICSFCLLHLFPNPQTYPSQIIRTSPYLKYQIAEVLMLTYSNAGGLLAVQIRPLTSLTYVPLFLTALTN